MSDMIEVQPTREQRRAFAAWAVAQLPKIRTVGINAFAVPAALFTEAPEEVLIGALVDGHHYVSPDEENGDEVPPHPECTASATELVGVATPGGLREVMPGQPLPTAIAEADGPDSPPLPGPFENSDSNDRAVEVPEGVFPCDGCDREFTSARGRETHRRQKHAEA
ncbi:hypothetical protein ACWD5R_31965 [Streptomyces sp. NPDC002514]|uniref:hypothetical protein n=1 Tax=Streptomyces sp. NPDC001270 TaxID=3364554 RepID=UPI00369A49AA